ncbi:MAG: Arylsulfatase [Planctomycetota bacterium]|jgi:arylsulfatase A-like enzyme
MRALIPFAWFAFAGCAGGPPAPKSLPNVVLIVSDDQGWADVGFHNPAVWSPTLDRLAGEGVRFDAHYVMPQCTPTRVALLTGRYPSRFGGAALEASNDPALPLGTPTLAGMFAEAGYGTYLCGKWHLGSDREHGPNAFGFASSYGSFAGAVGMYDHRYRKGPHEATWHRDGEPLPNHENGVHATDLVAQEAVRVIEGAQGKPFFLYVPFHSVHTPLDERGRFVERPTQLDPARPERWLDEDRIEWFHDPEGRIQRERDPEKRLLLAAVHHLDAAVARIVDALDRTGLRRDTLIVFLSDNGPQGSWPGNAYPDDLKLTDFNQPLPMRGKKLDLYEGGIRVPAFANWPGRLAGGVREAPVHAVDWWPTLAALLGRSGPADGDGVDLLPLLTRGQDPAERTLYWTWSRATNRWAVRRGAWKIVRYGKKAPEKANDWQLYDLANDPMERNDLATREPKRLAELHREYLRIRENDAR